MGTLTVYSQVGYFHMFIEKLWTESNGQKDGWQQAYINLKSTTFQYQIVFEADIMKDTGIIAIDDILGKDGYC